MYRLTGRLEQSQLADLYCAEKVGGEAVVVKLFHLKTSDAGYARVVGEVARQLQTVTHPGVARVLDVGLVDGQLAIVRQDAGKYTLGLALQRLNTREVHLPPALGLALALELLDAVGAAHQAGVVHGALTPGNIVLSVDGQISATDFGALRALEASPALKKSFGARGRSSYRAPELSTGGEPTEASDLYALGAITYELLTLREASTGHSTVSTRSERLPPPSRLVRRLHSRIDPVIMRALEPSAARRHRSCAEFAEGIREFLSTSGGVPGKADLAKFVAELFPNEVQVAALGPVPIERPFELTDIAGVGAIEAEAVEADDRKSFSGGFVDDRTPTSDGLPVFTNPETVPELPVKTELEVVAVQKRAVSDWEAPAGELPATAAQSGPTPQLNEKLKGRMKAVEDFAEIPGQPKAPPRELPPEQAPKTLVSFVVPGQKPIDRYKIAQEERELARRRVQQVRLMGAVILTGTVLFVAWLWYRGQSDPKGALISYLPDPIERQFAPENMAAPAPVKPSNPLKLPDFDKMHPDKAFVPKPNPEPVEKPLVEKTPVVAPKKVASDCFDPPSSGKLGYLTVAAMTSVRVDVDGKRVCVNATKLPLAVGAHKVKVTDVKSKQEDVSTIRVEAGKLVKLSPVFPKR